LRYISLAVHSNIIIELLNTSCNNSLAAISLFLEVTQRQLGESAFYMCTGVLCTGALLLYRGLCDHEVKHYN